MVRIRKISDLRNTLEKTNKAFDQALDAAKNRESPQSKCILFVDYQSIDMDHIMIHLIQKPFSKGFIFFLSSLFFSVISVLYCCHDGKSLFLEKKYQYEKIEH